MSALWLSDHYDVWPCPHSDQFLTMMQDHVSKVISSSDKGMTTPSSNRPMRVNAERMKTTFADAYVCVNTK